MSGVFHLQFLLPLRLYSMRPVILRLVAPVEDLGVGLPSPGALENPAGVSRTLSSLAVTGEFDPAAIPSNSGSSLGGIESSGSAGSTSMGWDLSRMLLMADANSASIGGVPGLVDVGDVLDAQLLIKGLFLTVFLGGPVLGQPLLLLQCPTLETGESQWYAFRFCQVPGFRELELSCHAGP